MLRFGATMPLSSRHAVMDTAAPGSLAVIGAPSGSSVGQRDGRVLVEEAFELANRYEPPPANVDEPEVRQDVFVQEGARAAERG